MMRRGKRRGCQHRAFVMLRVDALELHISGETGLELAHHVRGMFLVPSIAAMMLQRG